MDINWVPVPRDSKWSIKSHPKIWVRTKTQDKMEIFFIPKFDQVTKFYLNSFQDTVNSLAQVSVGKINK